MLIILISISISKIHNFFSFLFQFVVRSSQLIRLSINGVLILVVFVIITLLLQPNVSIQPIHDLWSPLFENLNWFMMDWWPPMHSLKWDCTNVLILELGKLILQFTQFYNSLYKLISSYFHKLKVTTVYYLS